MGPALGILLPYFGLTVIVLGLASADFGSVMVRIAFSKSALALSEITAVGSCIERSKAPQRELGWTYLPAREMWLGIVDQELELLASRKKRDLLSRLKPVETSE